MNLGETVSRLWEIGNTNITRARVRTHIEIPALAALLTIPVVTAVSTYESYRAYFQPAAFADYEQVEDKAKEEGRELNHLTKYYFSVNDYPNKYFEAWNFSSLWMVLKEDHPKWFAGKLDQAMDTTQRIYRRNIVDFAKMIPNEARGALSEVTDVRMTSATSGRLQQSFEKVWDYHHTESGHWEESCSTDSQGHRSCTSTYHCDSYHHYWNYHPQAGFAAAREISAAAASVPVPQRLTIEAPKKTHAWNEDMIRHAIKRELKREPTETEFLAHAQFYKTGSQYMRNIDPIRSGWNTVIRSDDSQWNQMKNTAHSYDKPTGCHMTEGPREYEYVEDLKSRLGDIVEHEQNITRPMVKAITAAPELEREAKLFILSQNTNWTAHFPEISVAEAKKMSPSKREGRVIDRARKMYTDNIPGGNPSTAYRLWLVVLAGIGAAAVGAGLGKLWDDWGDQNTAPKWYREHPDEDPYGRGRWGRY